MRFGLDERVIARIHEVLARHPQVEQAILYGSRAKGTYRPGSDIDLTLMGANLTWQDVSRIIHELDDLLLPYAFDISLYKDITDPDVLDHIRRVGVLFYQRIPSRSEISL